MPRPEYETSTDRDNEAKVIKEVERWGKCSAIKTPSFYPVDYCLERKGKVVCLAEIKTRTCLITDYPTYMISLHKVSTALQMAEVAGIGARLFVMWRDGLIGTLDLKVKPDYIGWGGRVDRADPQDMEPVCHYSLNDQWTMLL